jgi:hypothetical protein
MELIYQRSAEQSKKEIIKRYPELQAYFDALESKIKKFPHLGIKDSSLLHSGKKLNCFRATSNTSLFSGRLVYNRDKINLLYVFNDSTILIFSVYLSM